MFISRLCAQTAKKQFCLFSHLKRNLTLTIKQRICYACNVRWRDVRTTPESGPWNVLFFGNDEFSLESLKILHNKYRLGTLHRLEVVTTNKGNKHNVITKYATQHGIVVNQWPLQSRIFNYHIGIVVSFGYLIPASIIESFPLGVINVHASLLPRWRGAAPIVYSLMNGDNKTGITIMQIMPKIFDIGPIIAQKEVDIGLNETLPELTSKLAKLGAELLAETLEYLPQILLSAKPQGDENVTYAPKITSEIALIKWSTMPAKNIYDLQRALQGLYFLATKFQNMTIKLLEIQEVKKPPITLKWQNNIPGSVVYDKGCNALIVQCVEESWISVRKVIIPGRAAITANDFRNGFLSGKKKTEALFY